MLYGNWPKIGGDKCRRKSPHKILSELNIISPWGSQGEVVKAVIIE